MKNTIPTADEFIKLMNYSVDKRIYDKLAGMNFFTAPASINYHGNKEGGLYAHSKAVMLQLIDLTKKLNLKWERKESPYIVGMFHDICKCDNYIKINNKWAYNPKPIMNGHGNKSIVILRELLKGFMELTSEEELCICWHMGAFDEKENWDKYGSSVTKYPNVLYTHTADMIAARIIGI